VYALAGGPAQRPRDPRLAPEVVFEHDSDLIAAISEVATIREARDRAHAERAVPDRMSGYVTGGPFVLYDDKARKETCRS